MGLTNAFRDAIAAAVTGNTFTAYNNANSYIGVGDSTTAFANSQTDLQAATNKLRKGMDATYPTVAANVITFRATFTGTDANFHWQEEATFNASSSGTMMNRIVSDQSTKVSGQIWVATMAVTLGV